MSEFGDRHLDGRNKRSALEQVESNLNGATTSGLDLGGGGRKTPGEDLSVAGQCGRIAVVHRPRRDGHIEADVG
jgi:hypothetical protein